MRTVKLVALFGDNATTAFAQAFDVFERSKVFATKNIITLTVNDNFNPTTGIISVRDALIAAGNTVVCIFIPGDSESAYVDNSVVTVSNGTKWFLLTRFLKMYGIEKMEN